MLIGEPEILARANEIAQRYGLSVEIPEGIQSVGVGGDERTYTPIVFLIGPFPGWEVIEKISSEISSTLPINRVTYQIAKAK
ncbi:MAG: hypothetical protein AAB783_00400 [Patescibacteria group bacterium]